MGKIATAIIATTLTGAAAVGGYIAVNQLNQSNNSNVAVQQADTYTTKKVGNNLLGTWVKVDDPNTKVVFTPDDVTIIQGTKEDKGKYNLLCGGQAIEITGGDNAGLAKTTVEGGVLTIDRSNTKLKFKRAPAGSKPAETTDTVLNNFQPAKNELIGAWRETAAAEGDEPIKIMITADKIGIGTDEAGASYRFLCEEIIETDKGGSLGLVKVKVEGDALTWTTSNGERKLIRESNGGGPRVLTGHKGGVFSIAFSPDGKTLASGSWDDTVKLWNIDDGKELRTLDGHHYFVDSVAFSPDGKMLASGGDDGTIKLWNVEDGNELKTLSHYGPSTEIAFSPDGKRLATASMEHNVIWWNIAEGKKLKPLSGHTGNVTTVAFSPDGKTLATASLDKTIKLWNIEDGTSIKTLSGHSDGRMSIAFSPDGKTLASGSWDNTIKLWNIEDGTPIKTLSGHSEGVYSIDFSPDGKMLASGGGDKAVILWKVEDGTPIKTLSEHSEIVRTVAFSPDGKTLASGSSDQTIRLWPVE